MRVRFFVAGLVILACVPSGTAQAAEGRPVEVLLHDNPFHIAPERILANPGESVTFNVYNAGVIGHDFRVCRAEAEGGCNSPVVYVPVLQAGQWGNVTVKMPATGTYHFECGVPGHSDAGMVGELVIGPAKGTPGLPAAWVVLVLVAGFAWRRRST